MTPQTPHSINYAAQQAPSMSRLAAWALVASVLSTPWLMGFAGGFLARLWPLHHYAYLPWMLMVAGAPLISLTLGYAARRHIQYANGQLSGARLATGAIWLSILWIAVLAFLWVTTFPQ